VKKSGEVFRKQRNVSCSVDKLKAPLVHSIFQSAARYCVMDSSLPEGIAEMTRWRQSVKHSCQIELS